jgi:hypothetical protein
MTSYDRSIATLNEHAVSDDVDLGWDIKIHDDLLTHINAATKQRYSSHQEAWAAATELAALITQVRFKLVYRNRIGVDSIGAEKDDGSPESWRGSVQAVATPA